MKLDSEPQINYPAAKLWIDQVPLFFQKDLKGSVNELIYETKTLTEFDKGDSQTVALEIDGFVMAELKDWLKERYPHSCSFFKPKKAKLVIYFGRADWMGKEDDLQGLQVEEDGDMFLWWRVLDLSILNGLFLNINHYQTMNLRILLDVVDKHFDIANKDKGLNIPVVKLSTTFS